MQKVIGATVKKDGELLESLDFDAGGISKSVDWQGGGEFIYFNRCLSSSTVKSLSSISARFLYNWFLLRIENKTPG
jgi:hypothetical protein